MRGATKVVVALGGNALGTERYAMAAAVFAATLILSGSGLLVYRWICRRRAGGWRDRRSSPAAPTT